MNPKIPPKKRPSLRELCGKVIWDNQEKFITWQDDGLIDWGDIIDPVREYVLQNLEITPDTLNIAIKNGLAITAVDYLKRARSVLMTTPSVLLLRSISREPLPYPPNSHSRAFTTFCLKQANMLSLPMIVVGYHVQIPEQELSCRQTLEQFLEGVVNISIQSDDENDVIMNANDTVVMPPEFLEHRARRNVLACSPDASCVVSGDFQGEVWLWDLVSGERKKIIQHVGPVCGIKFHDSVVATRGADKAIRLFSLLTGVMVKMKFGNRVPTDITFHSRKPEMKIRFGRRSLRVRYPIKYLMQELSAEQFIVASAVNDIQRGFPTSDSDADYLRQALLQDPFEPQVQQYFESVAETIELV